MTLEQIRHKAQELRAKTRRKLIGLYGGFLAVAALCAFGMRFPNMQLFFVLPVLWSLAGLYFLNRGMWPAAMPGDAALIKGIDFYRQEIERRRTLFRRLLLWSFAPIMLAIVTFVAVLAMVAKARLFPNAQPFMILVIIWTAVYFVIRMREQRELRKEIEQLRDIENQSR